MFEVKDSKGANVNLKDEVNFTMIQEDMFSDGEAKEMSGIVVSLNSEIAVQVQPEEGPSVEVMATALVVTSSLINDVKNMATSEDMRAIIQKAEARFRDEVENGTNKKKSAGTKKTAKKKAVTGEIKLEL